METEIIKKEFVYQRGRHKSEFRVQLESMQVGDCLSITKFTDSFEKVAQRIRVMLLSCFKDTHKMKTFKDKQLIEVYKIK